MHSHSVYGIPCEPGKWRCQSRLVRKGNLLCPLFSSCCHFCLSRLCTCQRNGFLMERFWILWCWLSVVSFRSLGWSGLSSESLLWSSFCCWLSWGCPLAFSCWYCCWVVWWSRESEWFCLFVASRLRPWICFHFWWRALSAWWFVGTCPKIFLQGGLQV
jgi:hypothetical protein